MADVHKPHIAHMLQSKACDISSHINMCATMVQGDNNHADDRMLYNRGQKWLNRKHIMGRAKAFVPYVGMVTIVMNDYPALKVAVIGLLGVLCLLGLDE